LHEDSTATPDEMEDPDYFLNMLVPQDKEGNAKDCLFFTPKKATRPKKR
jgi:hypothetical protein